MSDSARHTPTQLLLDVLGSGAIDAAVAAAERFWQSLVRGDPSSSPVVRSAALAAPSVGGLATASRCSLAHLLFFASLSDGARDYIAAIRHLLPHRESELSLNGPLPRGPLHRATHRARRLGEIPHVIGPLSVNGFLAWVSTLLRNSCGDTESQESAARILDAAALRSLSIVSLNVWGLPSLMGYGAKHPERFSKLRGALRNAPYDIVALQEMWDPRTDVIRHESGYPFSASDVSASTLWRASGLLTLSRHPITVSEFLPFSRQSGVERAVRKGALFTRVETAPGHLVDVYNVHLASEPEKINTMLVSTREVKAIRTAQLDQLSEWITRRRLGATPVLVVGDLNVHEYDPEYISLANRLGTDTFRTRHPADTASDGGYTFDPERNPFALSPTMRPERIDYVFSLFSEDAEVTSSERIFVEDPLSDHYGLHTTFYY